MGFEQLAALRDQLAAERAAREGKKQDRPAKTTKAPNEEGQAPRGSKPSNAAAGKPAGGKGRPAGKPGGKPAGARQGGDKAAGGRSEGAERKPQGNRRPAKAQPETPRDPVLVAIGRLQHAFPKAFPKKPDPRVPLKLGIVEDLYAHTESLRLSQDEIKAAIAAWCSVGRYWASLTKDAVRVDINGEPSGTVTPAEAGHASFLARQQRKKAQAAAKAAGGEQAAEAANAAPAPDATNAPGDDTASGA